MLQERETRLQAPRRWHSWSSDQALALRRWFPARAPINSPGQAVRLRDLGTRKSETVELSQKLIFLRWEKDEAKSFFSCLPCKPLPHEEIKFNSFAVAAPVGSRWPLVGSDPAHGGCLSHGCAVLARSTQCAQPGAAHTPRSTGQSW